MAIWTDVVAAPAVGKEGLIAEGYPCEVDSYIAEVAVRAGFVVGYGTDVLTTRNQVVPLPALPVADPNAMNATFFPSALVAVRYSTAAQFDGAVGLGRIQPPQAVTLTFNASADWDGPLGFSVHTVHGEDADGHALSEDLVRNNVGAVLQVATTRQCFSRVSNVDVGAGSGAGGQLLVGTDPTFNEIGKLCFPGIVCYDVAREPTALAAAALTFDAGETLACLKRGRIWCVARTAVAPGDPVMVRTTAGGGILRGALYGIEELAAGSAFARYMGAQWVTPAALGGLAIVEVE